jgi:hypothetical protein
MSAISPIDGRSCQGCTLCCKLLGIVALDKRRLEWCRHCAPGTGCEIYPSRPDECRVFHCGYLRDAQIAEHWNPRHSKMVVAYESASRLAIHVDPGRPDAWRREPYFSEIKRWARVAAAQRGQVVVWQGRDVIVVLPDREKNLGPLRADQLIVTTQKRVPAGIEWDAFFVDGEAAPVAAAPDDIA